MLSTFPSFNFYLPNQDISINDRSSEISRLPYPQHHYRHLHHQLGPLSQPCKKNEAPSHSSPLSHNSPTSDSRGWYSTAPAHPDCSYLPKLHRATSSDYQSQADPAPTGKYSVWSANTARRSQCSVRPIQILCNCYCYCYHYQRHRSPDAAACSRCTTWIFEC